MNEWKFLVVGHGKFPEGVASAIDLLLGGENILTYFNLDETTSHDAFTKKIHAFASMYPNVIAFADLNGGAPHMITAQALNERTQHFILLSNISVPFVLEVCLQKSNDLDHNIETILLNADIGITFLKK